MRQLAGELKFVRLSEREFGELGIAWNFVGRASTKENDLRNVYDLSVEFLHAIADVGASAKARKGDVRHEGLWVERNLAGCEFGANVIAQIEKWLTFFAGSGPKDYSVGLFGEGSELIGDKFEALMARGHLAKGRVDHIDFLFFNTADECEGHVIVGLVGPSFVFDRVAKAFKFAS